MKYIIFANCERMKKTQLMLWSHWPPNQSFFEKTPSVKYCINQMENLAELEYDWLKYINSTAGIQ
jgi:hypothetical protein